MHTCQATRGPECSIFLTQGVRVFQALDTPSDVLPMGVTNANDSMPSARRARTTPCRLLQFLARGQNNSQYDYEHNQAASGRPSQDMDMNTATDPQGDTSTQPMACHANHCIA